MKFTVQDYNGRDLGSAAKSPAKECPGGAVFRGGSPPEYFTMKNQHTRNFRLALLAAGLLFPTLGVVAQETKPWSLDVTPYLWVAGVEVQTGLPSTPSTVDRFNTRISGGAMLGLEARYESVGLFVDFAWLRLDTTAKNPGPLYSAVDLRSDIIHSTAALSYRVPMSGKWHADLLAGARLWNVNEDLEFHPGVLGGFGASGGQTWVDPMVGADLRYDLGANWFLVAKGLVGGFGTTSAIDGEAFGGVGYQFNETCSAILGYRYLHEEHHGNNFKFNLDAQGFLLGFGFHF